MIIADLKDVKIGSTQVSKIYLGNTQLWTKTSFPTSGILAYYKLDNASGLASTVDSSGNSNTLVPTSFYNTSSSIASVTGKINGGAYFESQYGQTFVFSLADSPGTGDFSVSLWFKAASGVASYPAVFGGNYIYLSIYVLDGIVSDGIRVAVAGGDDISIPGVVSQGVFYNLVLKRSSGTVSVYLNGAVVATGTNAGFIDFTNLYLGSNSYGSDTCFEGIIDEVGIWNRALTTTEISNLYNSGNGLAYSS